MNKEDELFEQTGTTAVEWLRDADYFISRFERKCQKLFTDYNPRLDPIVDTLYYEYDYGDGWCMKITVIEKYEGKKMDRTGVTQAAGEGAADGLLGEELNELIEQVRRKLAPRCIASDGLSVPDDVGGIGGFHDMLRVLECGDPEEKASTKEWARGLGWRGTLSKPEFML